MLLYMSQVPSGGAIVSTYVTQYCWGENCVSSNVLSYKQFPTLESALTFINHRECPTCPTQNPDLQANNIVGLFKTRRIELELAANGKKLEIYHEVRQKEVVPEQRVGREAVGYNRQLN